MRSWALLLVLSLVSPAVVSAVCELTCLHAHHHTGMEAKAAECHGHDAVPASAVVVTAADAALCHDGATVPSAIVKASAQLASMPAVVNGPRPPEFRAPTAFAPRGRVWLGPPSLLLITTQLRI